MIWNRLADLNNNKNLETNTSKSTKKKKKSMKYVSNMEGFSMKYKPIISLYDFSIPLKGKTELYYKLSNN